MTNRNDLFLGLDIGGTKCAAIIGTVEGQIIAREEWLSASERGPGAMIDDLYNRSNQLMAKQGRALSAGVSVGGPLDSENGIVLSPPNLPGWNQIPLKQILADRLGIPVTVEHDAAACALAEFRWGAGQGASRLIYLTCGTGFGAGLVFDGKAYHGAAGKSAEIGHARFRDDGPEAFGKRGSIESFCAGSSLGRIAAWKFPARWPTAPPGEELAKLANSGDADAIEVIRINAQAVGEVCANLADLLRPDLILLGSLSRHLGGKWVEQVRSRFHAEALDSGTSCRIEPAGLAERLQDCSALVVALTARVPKK